MDATVSAGLNKNTAVDAPPAITGVEDIVRVEQREDHRVAEVQAALTQQKQETDETYQRNCEKAVGDKKREKQAELEQYKEEKLSRILEEAQSGSADACAALDQNFKTHSPKIVSSLLTEMTGGGFLPTH